MMNEREKLDDSEACWSHSEKEYGYTVRVFEIYPGSNLYRSVWVNGREDKKSLRHKDKRRAIKEARQLHVCLATNGVTPEPTRLALGQLLTRYLGSAAHAAKSERTRREDARKLRRVIEFLGQTRNVVSLGKEDVLRYSDARRSGDRRLSGIRPRREGKSGPVVRDRAIEADLIAVRTMLNWGRGEKDERGRPLLSHNPLQGVKFPRELNPRRPSLSQAAYQRLLEVAPQVSPTLRYALVIAHEAGRRVGAWRRLRWSDVDLEYRKFGGIWWSEETDKKKRRMLRPITRAARDALLALRQTEPGSQWVFPHPGDASVSCSRELLDDQIREAYQLAGLHPDEGGIWHPFRRKWVTDRKRFPLKDLAAAGGWKSVQTLVTCYMQEDDDTIEEIILSTPAVAATPLL